MAHAPLSPLDVLLAAMQQRWEEERLDEAAEFARMAAPYVHGRRGTMRDITELDFRRLSDAEIDRFLAAFEDDEGEGTEVGTE